MTKEDFFRQLLRLVYRLIFVMTAEDREILHPDGADEARKDRLRERLRDGAPAGAVPQPDLPGTATTTPMKG